jgi:hypothetical protein
VVNSAKGPRCPAPAIGLRREPAHPVGSEGAADPAALGGGLELQKPAGLPVAGLRIESGLRGDQSVDESGIDPVKLRRRLDRGPDFALRRRRLDGRARAGGRQTTKTQPD